MLEDQLQLRRRKQHPCYSRLMDDYSPAFPGSSAHTLQIKHGSPAIHESPSGGQHSESNTAAYFLWPGSTRLNDTAEERASYFWGLQKQLDSDGDGALPAGQQATTMLDLMIIRAFHSKILRRYSLGTAVGFRMRKGALTDIPAILVFVARKVHRRWLLDCQVLPTILEGPGGIWCDVDVVEFSYYTSLVATPKEQVYTELVEGLRGSDPRIGPGSQVSSQETYGTLGTIVRSRTGSHQVGFLTNRHVAVDLDYPNQKMFHPLPPNLGPGVYLGAVERATSFITDELWYGIFASSNPETFVRADGAFVPFSDSFDMSKVTTIVKGVGEMGEVMRVDLQAPVGSLIGKRVVKVGRSSGLTKEKPRPIGIIWGGTANRGRLKLKDGLGPENWTSAVDLGRLLDLLQLDLVTTDISLQATFVNDTAHEPEGVEGKPECVSSAASDPTVEELPPKGCTSPITSLTVKSKYDGCQTLHFEDMSSYGSRLAPQSSGIDMDVMFRQNEFVTRLAEPSTSVEHQFMQDFHVSLGHPNPSRNQFPENLSGLRDSKDGSNDDISIGLQLGDNTKRRRTT
ncbi:unnamed protein product [Victoria cruziana]